MSGVTPEQLFERFVAEARARDGEEPTGNWLEYLRLRAFDPAVLLSENTTACPAWCDGQHDNAEEYVIHAGPEVFSVRYEGWNAEDPAGWRAQLVAYEYVVLPGVLRELLIMDSDFDGLHPGDFFEMPVEWVPSLAGVSEKLRALTVAGG